MQLYTTIYSLVRACSYVHKDASIYSHMSPYTAISVNGAKLCQSARGVPSSPLAQFNTIWHYSLTEFRPLRLYSLVQPCTAIYNHIRACTRIYTHIYTHIHAYTGIYKHIHAYTHIYKHMHAYIPIYTHIHACTHKYTHTETSPSMQCITFSIAKGRVRSPLTPPPSPFP